MAFVLIVDDEVELAQLLGMRLETLGWQVAYAYDGATALAHLATEIPDAIVLDVVMPGLNGWMVGEKIRALPALTDLPIIYMTARQAKDVSARAAALQAPVLLKPFRVEALIALLPSPGLASNSDQSGG